MKTDEEMIRDLLPHWYAVRKWAEELLYRGLGLATAPEVLRIRPKQVRRAIPGSTWTYTTHGIGVDLDRGNRCGGIDFDFDKPDPDVWRLSVFAEKQLNAGNLSPEYQALFDDQDRFEAAASRALTKTLERRSMPVISTFFGIVIRMFYREHGVAHFHAEHQGQQATFTLDGQILAGNLSSRTALRLIREWTLAHTAELEANWSKGRSGEPLERIAPLD